MTITPSKFWVDGCYRRSLARQNKGVMGVIGVNGPPFALVKIDFFAFFQNFDGCYKGIWRSNKRVMGVLGTNFQGVIVSPLYSVFTGSRSISRATARLSLESTLKLIGAFIGTGLSFREIFSTESERREMRKSRLGA